MFLSKMASNTTRTTKTIKIEKTEEFIAEYEHEECLWNVLDENYKNRDLKQASLEKLARRFQISGIATYFIFGVYITKEVYKDKAIVNLKF